MSETTEILFNSPALHSLRRDQLQKLCKIHSIKANGKNTELIDRLKQHAFTLPKDDPLSIAARSERDGSYSDSSSNGREEDGVSEGEVEKTQMQRPSEQWEVMESIQEVEETASSQGALSSLRTPGTAHSFEEFGTTNSKTSSVTSSIKALANSLGLKQAVKLNELSVPSVPSKASGEMFSIPYSATRPATPPLNDNFTFDPTTAPQTRMRNAQRTMSETTEILFNSPALHSLRRDQLQKLCKIHSIKANGKNTELIDRLKRHAFTLPKDDPLSIAARSERDGSYSDSSSNGREEDGVSEGEVEKTQMQRPSEQWEVMESIQEVEETASSQGALSSLRTPGTAHSFEEFGTTNSKTSSVTSSIKALANSLGLKQAVKLNELSASSVLSKASGEMFSIPYSATRPATPPLNDNFTFDPTTAPQTRMSYDANGEPLPGCALRPGEPAPENARLSMGLGLGAVQSTTPKKEEPTTTIRLVSTKGSSSDDALKPDSRMEIFHTPKLKPFATNFDLVMSPSAQDTATAGGSKTFWAPDTRPRQFKSIYPTLTIDDLPPDVPPSPFKIGGDKLDINAVMNTASSVTSSIKALANSLGLKQAVKLNELSASSVLSKASGEMFSIPYSATRPATPPLNDNFTGEMFSIPYSATRPATPPLNDNFTFDPTTAPQTRMSYDANGEPLPGCALRPGEPAPENARLSMGLGLGAVQSTTPKKEEPTTTIRLVSTKGSSSDDALKPDSRMEIFHTPKLKPFATNFDLVMSPSAQDTTTAGGSKTFWAPDTRPRQFKSIYPILTIDDLPPDVPPSPFKIGGDKLDINAVMNTGKDTLEVPTLTTTTSRNASTNMDSRATPEPFVFGSPRHSVTNTEFRAAATSILEEMNKRLLGSGVEGVGMDIIGKLQPGAHTEAQLRDMKPLPRASVGGVKPRGSGEITKKFDEMHQADFDKMEGIDGAVKRRMEKKEVPPLVIGKKRKSNALGELDGKAKENSGKDEDAMNVDIEDQEAQEQLEEQRRESRRQEREREAIKRKLEMSRAKRRSSVGGAVAAATKSATVAASRRNSRAPPATPNPKPSRFGFLTSAKKLVASVWNRGKTPASKPTTIAAAATAGSTKSSRVSAAPSSGASSLGTRRSTTSNTNTGNGVGSMGLKPKSQLRASSLGSSRLLAPTASSLAKMKNSTALSPPTSTTATTKKSLLGSITNSPKVGGPTAGFVPNRAAGTSNTSAAPSTSTATPMPSDPTGSKLSAPQLQDQKNPSSSNTARSRSPIPPTFNKPLSTGASTSNIKTSSIRASSTGSTKSSRVSAVPSSGASSLGTKRSTTSNTNTGNGAGSMGLKPKSQLRASSSGSSRLLAPTASSLAKMKNSTALSPPTSTTATTKKSLLGSITNSPKVGGGMPRRGGATVFSPTPLQGTRKASGSVLSPRTNATPVKIFSKPVMTKKPSGIPVMVKSAQKKGVGLSETSKTPGGTTVTRQRMLTRKPRISRSKVIAKLASQRLAASSSLSSTARSRSPIPPTFNKPLSTGASTSNIKTSSIRASSTGSTKSSRVSAVPSSGASSLGTKRSTTSNTNTGNGAGSMGLKPKSQLRASSSGSSRLLAPTASSLAKMKNSTALSPRTGTTATTKKSLLGSITNSPKVGGGMPRRGGATVFSPTPLQGTRKASGSVLSPRTNATPVKIFSKPVMTKKPSGIPVMVKSAQKKGVGLSETSKTPGGTTVTRQRMLTRKPRISRSKVIAKLASQLSGVQGVHVSGCGLRGKRTRSSIGVGSSSGVGGGSAGGRMDKERSVLASAKKRVRQSEYARRRSRMSVASSGLSGGDECV
ncbi:hypothetical protein AN958_05713 [Leucoagaricus sp. SymC.cos]|nr:hypothetical protein AN958_05713 [Leucoagaricus sp. SymC.cos]